MDLKFIVVLVVLVLISMDKQFAKSIGIEQYNGISDFKEFEKSFNLNALMFGWDEGKQFLALPFLLTGKAESICDKLETKTTVKHIMDALRIGCKVADEVLVDRFFERKPEPGELLSAFARALAVLIVKGLPGLPTKEKEILLRRQLGSYLPEHMRALIHFNSHKSWDELLASIDQAMPHTMALAGAKTSESFGAMRSDYPTSISIKAEPLELNSLNSRPKFNGICNYCKQEGHMKADCEKAKAATLKNERDSRGSQGRPSNSSSNGSSSRYGNNNNNSYSNNRDSNYRPSGNPSYRSDRDSKQSSQRSNNSDRDRGMGARRHVNTMELQVDSDDDNNCYDDCIDHGIISVDTCGIDVHETPVLDLMSVSARVPLLKRATYVTFGKSNVTFRSKALFDGGAMCSFMQLTSLPSDIQRKIVRFLAGHENELNLILESVIIRGATSEVTENCAIAMVKLKIGDWTGNHSFIISDKLGDKEIIIGRDFMKKHGVVIDHGADSIKIRKPIKFNNEKEREPMPISEVNGILVRDRVVAPRSEVIVLCHTTLGFAGKDVVFVPKANEIGTYWSNSVDTVDENGNIRVSVVNLRESPLVLKAGMYLGYGSTAFEIVPDSTTLEMKVVDAAQAQIGQQGVKEVNANSSAEEKLS